MKFLLITKQLEIMDIPQRKTQNILKDTALMNTYPHENSQEKEKREICPKNHFLKTISTTIIK